VAALHATTKEKHPAASRELCRRKSCLRRSRCIRDLLDLFDSVHCHIDGGTPSIAAVDVTADVIHGSPPVGYVINNSRSTACSESLARDLMVRTTRLYMDVSYAGFRTTISIARYSTDILVAEGVTSVIVVCGESVVVYNEPSTYH
jgi:hypothetical protein